MKLKKLIIKNIRSYSNQEINFPEGSSILSGDVGSGKTSILLAIEYALFGLQPGQTGSALLRNNSDVGEVTLEFELLENQIIIERKLKRGKSVVNDYSAITINGDKKECSITELKSKIISLLGYPSEFIKKNNLLYRYTVYTPQEQMKLIISEESEARLNILRHIFGIDKYKTIRENLVILLSKIKDDSKILQGEISSLDFDKGSLVLKNSSLMKIERKIDEQTIVFVQTVKKRRVIEGEALEIEKKIKEGEKLETELEKAKVLLATKKDNLASIQKEISEIEKDVLESKGVFNETDLISLLKQIEKNSREIELMQNSYISSLSEINSLRKRRQESEKRKDTVFNIDFCPTCLQNVPIAHKHNILNETENKIGEISKEILSLEEKVKSLIPDIDKLKKERKILEEKKLNLEVLRSKTSEFEKSRKKTQELLKIRESLENDISLLTRHLESLKEGILSYSRFHNTYKSKQDELKKAFLQEKNSEIALAESKKEVELTKKEIFSLEQQISEKEGKKKRLAELLELNDWLSGHFLDLINFTERNIMLKLRNDFSKLFSKWFSLLVQDSFEVHLDENFTPIIMQSGIEMDYSFLSGGERTAVALAYRLALNQTINSVMTTIQTKDLVILDEPTEGFSEAQTDKIREVLQELNVKQLILVSHEPKIEGFVDHVIKIKKEGNSSAVEIAT